MNRVLTSELADLGALHSKQALVTDTAALGLSRYLAFGVSFLVSIVQKALLGPHLVGVWQILSIVRQYLSYGDLGVLRGAEQRLPPLYAKAAGELETTRAVAYSFVLGPVLAINALLFAASFVWPWSTDPLILWGWRAMVGIATIESAANTLEVAVLRSPLRFRLVSLQFCGSELLFAVLSIPGILLWGLYGLIGSAALSLLFRLGFMRATTGEWFRFRFDLGLGIALWRVGFPVTVYAVLFKTFEMLDRLLLLREATPEFLGFYSVATMATIFLGHVPLVISQAFYPRTMTWVGTRSRDELARYLRQAQLSVALVMGTAVGLCYFGLPPLVTLALPAFTSGIGAMKVAVFSAIFFGLVDMPIQYQIAWNRQWPLVFAVASATALLYGAGLLGLRVLGSPGSAVLLVAWSRVIGFGLLWLAIGWWTLRNLHDGASSSRRIAEIAGVVSYTAVLIVAIDRLLIPGGSTIGAQVVELGGSLALFALGLWPLVRYVDHRTGVIALVGRARPWTV